MTESDGSDGINEAATLPVDPAHLASSPRAQLPRGAAIGRYLVVSLIGSGGMGTVYAAYDPDLDRRVAIKLLCTVGDHASRLLLVREARVLGQISHPNVVQVHDVGESGGDVFVAMELVEGESLDAWCQRSPPPRWQEVLAAYVDVARGLAAAHARGVVHRDVKPANILRGKDGRVRVVDFGIALGATTEAPLSLRGGVEGASASGPLRAAAGPSTAAEPVMGTPLYMAPEQLAARASPASDQYSLCVSLYEGLYGAPPFAFDLDLPLTEAIVRHFARKQQGPPPLPSATAVPRWIGVALSRGLAPRAEDRYPSMEALVAALTSDPEAPRRAFRRMAGVGAAAGALVVLAAVGWARGALADPCAHPEQHLVGVWDEGVRARVRGMLGSAARAGAAETAARVVARLDRQAADYAAMRGEVCRTARSGKQRREILDLRDACLSRRRGQLQALATLLGEEPDAQVLDRAVTAAAGLPPVSTCADVEALTARVRPPEDSALRARVDALQPHVDRLETLYTTGKYKEGLALAEQVLPETAAVPYPPLRGQALLWAGRINEGIGDFETARARLLEAARSAAEGGDDVLVATAWTRFFFVVAERQQHVDEAAQLRPLGAIAVARANDDRVRAIWLNAEGLSLFRAGKPAEAKAAHEQALAIRERVLGPDHPDVAGSFNNLALVLDDLGDFPAAIRSHERALALRERLLGPEHPDVAQTLNNLGTVLQDTADFAGARTAFERSLAIREKVLAPDSSDLAQTLDNLATARFKLGDLAGALAAEERALGIFEKRLGPYHANLAKALRDLGAMLAARGDLQQALAVRERAAAMFERVRGAENGEYGDALADVGASQHLLGDDAGARVTYERALAILEKAFGPEHIAATLRRAGLARVQIAEGRLDAAQAVLDRALPAEEKALGAQHSALAEALLARGELALARRKPQEAEPPLARALALADAEYRPAVQRTLAEARWQLGPDRAGARTLAEEARAAYEKAGDRAGVTAMDRWLAEHRLR